MKVKTYKAIDMQEAMRLIKRDLGPHAVILSTRKVMEGKKAFGLLGRPTVEVTAASETPEPRPAEDQAGPQPEHPVAQHNGTARSLEVIHGEIRELREGLMGLAHEVRTPHEGLRKGIRDSIEELRWWVSFATRRWGGEAWLRGSEVAMEALSRLIRHGMRESHAVQILERIQAATVPGQDDRGEFQERLRLYLSRLARVCAPLTPAGERPNVLALVGPTGVGKTTTAAKLAAHWSMGEGRKVAMITNDTYRVAAVEQLRAYAKIMGVEFRVVFQPGDLPRVLEELAGSEVIIMDTAGRNPFDSLQMAELKELITADPRVSAVLVVSANGDPQGLERVVQEFSILRPVGLIGTKLDEAIHFGGLFSLSIQSRLPFAYFTHGQKVPEDIRQATREDMAAWTIFGIPSFCVSAASGHLG